VIVPQKQLLLRFKFNKVCQPSKVAGTLPVNKLNDKSRSVRLLYEASDGMVPVRLFEDKCSVVRLGKPDHTQVGTLPATSVTTLGLLGNKGQIRLAHLQSR